MIDLHMHTTCSDGTHTPEQVVALAAKNKVDTISITDHDTVSGLPEAINAANKLGIRLIPGIEISSRKDLALHILGYGFSPDNKILLDACENFTTQRENREQRIYTYLAQRGVLLTPEQVQKYAAHTRVSRPHFALSMVENGYVSSVEQAFTLHLATPEFRKIDPDKPTPKQAIELIHAARGTAVLAHPGLLKKEPAVLEALLAELVSYGLDGLEVYYQQHTSTQIDFFTKMAEKYNLFCTTGSDFHGQAVKPNIQIGDTGFSPSLAWKQNVVLNLYRNAK